MRPLWEIIAVSVLTSLFSVSLLGGIAYGALRDRLRKDFPEKEDVLNKDDLENFRVKVLNDVNVIVARSDREDMRKMERFEKDLKRVEEDIEACVPRETIENLRELFLEKLGSIKQELQHLSDLIKNK